MERRNALVIVLSLAGVALVSGCQGQDAAQRSPRDRASSETARSTVTPVRVTAPVASRAVKPQGVLPAFRMIAAEAGLDFQRMDDIQGLWRITEVNGGGVALFDFDRDGRLDVFFNNGCRLPLSLGDRETRCEFFRNVTGAEGDLAAATSGAEPTEGSAVPGFKFERVTDQSTLVQYGYTFGCAVGDFNDDGFDDLYITAIGGSALWANNGDGSFVDVTEETGTQVSVWGSSAAFADLNGDGFLDLYVATYLDESTENPKLCPHPGSPDGYISCPPSQYEGVDDVLFVADGAGRFVDCTATAGLGGLRGKGLGVVISDLDLDGTPEIYVANDGESNFLLVRTDQAAAHDASTASGDAGGRMSSSPGDLRYADRALQAGVALNESGYAQASMGVTAGDCDANGYPDLFLSHFINDTNTLYLNRGALGFEDATRSSHLGVTSRQTLGWGTVFVDFDNDSWLDLIVANGHVDDRRWQGRGEPYQMRPHLYRNERDGSFLEVAEWGGDYFAQDWLGRGVAAGDLDRDGRIDLAISHQRAPSVVLRNETQSVQFSVTLNTAGVFSNRNGYGVRIELVDTEGLVIRELVGGGSFQSASAAEIHVGIGSARSATIRVTWPSGRVETHRDIPPGRWMMREGGRIRSTVLVNSSAGS